MHTRDDLTLADFALAIDSRPAPFTELLPGLTLDSRVAIVAHTAGGVFGGAATLLGLVTHWYAERARAGDDFFEYPDYFYLQVGGGRRADLRKLEVWPPHRQLAVGARTQDLLEAIVDRAVDYLLVEDGVAGSALVRRETRNALPRRLRGALAYGSSSAAARADVAVRSSPVAERYVALAIEDSVDLGPQVRHSARQLRRTLAHDGRATERLRRVSLQEAVELMCAGAEPDGATADHEDIPRASLVRIGDGAEPVAAR